MVPLFAVAPWKIWSVPWPYSRLKTLCWLWYSDFAEFVALILAISGERPAEM